MGRPLMKWENTCSKFNHLNLCLWLKGKKEEVEEEARDQDSRITWLFECLWFEKAILTIPGCVLAFVMPSTPRDFIYFFSPFAVRSVDPTNDGESINLWMDRCESWSSLSIMLSLRVWWGAEVKLSMLSHEIRVYLRALPYRIPKAS